MCLVFKELELEGEVSEFSELFSEKRNNLIFFFLNVQVFLGFIHMVWTQMSSENYKSCEILWHIVYKVYDIFYINNKQI